MKNNQIRTGLVVFAVVVLFSNVVFAANEKKLTFENVYTKPFWQNNYFVWGTIIAVSAGAAAFTTMTAGTGAPAAAVGVSTIASTLAGGGAGSYMAGLSMIGGWVGGNAIVGAAILNAGSAALIGGSALKTIPTAAVVTLETMRRLGPVILIPKEDKKELNFNITVPPTTSIGTESIVNLVERTEIVAEELHDNKISGNQAEKKYKEIASELRFFVEKQTGVITDEFLEEKVSALILARQLGYTNEFSKYTKGLPERGSFVSYLKAVAYLDDQDYERASSYALDAMVAEEDAVEPILVRILALSALNNYNEALALEKNIDNADEDNHKSAFSKASAYNLLGDYSSYVGNYAKAAFFYNKVYDDLSYIDSDEDKALISGKLAASLRQAGNYEKARKYYEKAMDYADDSEKSSEIKKAVEIIYREGVSSVESNFKSSSPL